MIKAVYNISSISIPHRHYIGSSYNYEKRKKEHLNKLKNGVHHSAKLQRHYNKYGIDDINISIIKHLTIHDDILKEEQFYIDTTNPYFNSCKLAGNTLGFKHSKETRDKMSASKKGKRSHDFTEETRKKMSDARKLRITKPETRIKMSIARSGEKNYNYGKKHPKETIEKMRLVKIGKKMSNETREKHRKNRTGKASKGRLVINSITGAKYATIKAAAKEHNINISTLQAMLSGRNPNKTNLKYLEIIKKYKL